MHFPGNIAKKVFSRLISLGAVVIVIGVALIGFQDAAKVGMNLKQPVLTALVCIGIEVLFVTIAVMAAILQRTWNFKGVKICSKTAQKKVSLNQGNPELAGMDMDVDEKGAEDEGFQKSTRFQIGDALDIQLRIKSLKPMEILKAIPENPLTVFGFFFMILVEKMFKPLVIDNYQIKKGLDFSSTPLNCLGNL